MDELSVSINFLTFDRDRMKLLESDVLKNPAVIRDMCVSLLLLGISTGLFLRALITPRRIARIANQNRENLAEENSAVPEQQNINVQQGQENRFAFFQPVPGPANAEPANAFNSKTDDGPNNKKTR